MSIENVVIIGSGPAAHTAAIYTARAQLQPLLFEGMMAGGIAAGGQLTTTTDIENFPGFPEAISGFELMDRMRRQSLVSGTRIETKTVKKVDLNTTPFKVFADDVVLQAKALIIATGATAKRLGIKGEERFWQKGISACAVCDGGLPIFRNKALAVIGGGDTACEETLYLTKFASRVFLFVRRDVLRASRAMQEKVLHHPKVTIAWETHIIEALGDQMINKIKTRHAKTNEEHLLDVSGLFYAVGHSPNTDFLSGQVALDDSGYILTTPGTTQTSIPGVFACGDVQDKHYRQAITAAGSGCMAAIDVDHYLKDHE
jgi:thioredoxin reductase (NADPH)